MRPPPSDGCTRACGMHTTTLHCSNSALQRLQAAALTVVCCAHTLHSIISRLALERDLETVIFTTVFPPL